jgi:hypothetical protein
MSQNSVTGASLAQRLAMIAHVGILAGALVAASFLAVTALQSWRVSPPEAGIAVAPEDDAVRNGLQIQEPLARAAQPLAPAPERHQPLTAELRTWRYTGASGGATGVHGGGGNHGSPGH